MTDVSTPGPTLRDLFTQAMAVWREAKTAEQYADLWPPLRQAAASGREALDVGLHFIKSPDAAYRAVGVDLLGCVAAEHPQARPAVAKAVIDHLADESDLDVLWSMITALGATAVVDVVPLLLRALSHPSSALRAAAVQALGSVASDTGWDDDVVDALARAMEDADKGVAYWATYALGTLCDGASIEVQTALSKRLFDTNNEVRLEAVVGLARRKDPRMFTTVEQALLNPNVPARVFDAAYELADPRLVPYLERADQRNVSDNDVQSVLERCASGSEVR